MKSPAAGAVGLVGYGGRDFRLPPGNGIRLILLGVGLVVAFAAALPPMVKMFALTAILLVYLGNEMSLSSSLLGERRLLNPAVITSVVMFGILLGASNFIYIIPGNDLPEYLMGDTAYDWMWFVMLYVLAGAAAMWSGYRGRAGGALGSYVSRRPFLRKVIRRGYDLNRPFVLVALAAGVGVRWLQASLGVFGYSSDADRLAALAGITQYLAFGADLGKLALVGLALAFFRGDRDPATRVLLVASLALETAFGFLSGFKYQVLVPWMIVAFCHYAVRGRLLKGFTAGMIVLIALSYAVIEPFRAFRFGGQEFEGRDIASIGMTMVEQARGEDPRDVIDEPLTRVYLMGFLGRVSSLPDAAVSIQYKRQTELSDDAPSFLGDIFLAPVYSVVPRLLWPSKPVHNLGGWYGIHVRGEPVTSVGAFYMTPIGYLYFAGGGAAIVLGFYLLGMIQRVIAESFHAGSAGSIVILLGIAPAFAVLESSYGVFLSTLMRTVPLLGIAQYLLFRR